MLTAPDIEEAVACAREALVQQGIHEDSDTLADIDALLMTIRRDDRHKFSIQRRVEASLGYRISSMDE